MLYCQLQIFQRLENREPKSWFGSFLFAAPQKAPQDNRQPNRTTLRDKLKENEKRGSFQRGRTAHRLANLFVTVLREASNAKEETANLQQSTVDNLYMLLSILHAICLYTPMFFLSSPKLDPAFGQTTWTESPVEEHRISKHM